MALRLLHAYVWRMPSAGYCRVSKACSPNLSAHVTVLPRFLGGLAVCGSSHHEHGSCSLGYFTRHLPQELQARVIGNAHICCIVQGNLVADEEDDAAALAHTIDTTDTYWHAKVCLEQRAGGHAAGTGGAVK